LVKFARIEFGEDHSEYARTVFDKANTLLSTSSSQPIVILDELALSQEAEVRALEKNGRSVSPLLLRILLLKGTVLLKLMANHNAALTAFTLASDLLEDPVAFG